MSNRFFAIYHIIEEFSFDKYGFKRESKQKKLLYVSNDSGMCEDKIKEHENKIEIKDNVIVAEYWYYTPITIKEDTNALREKDAFEKMTSKWDPLEGVFGSGKSESAVDTLTKGLFG